MFFRVRDFQLQIAFTHFVLLQHSTNFIEELIIFFPSNASQHCKDLKFSWSSLVLQRFFVLRNKSYKKLLVVVELVNRFSACPKIQKRNIFRSLRSARPALNISLSKFYTRQLASLFLPRRSLFAGCTQLCGFVANLKSDNCSSIRN